MEHQRHLRPAGPQRRRGRWGEVEGDAVLVGLRLGLSGIGVGGFWDIDLVAVVGQQAQGLRRTGQDPDRL